MEIWMIVSIGIGGMIIFVGFWCAISLLISKFGWAKLAKDFTATAVPAGKRYGFVSAWFRPLTSYKNSLKVTLTDEGVHLAMNPLFRMGHPPLLIPWQHVVRCSEHHVLAYSKLRIDICAAGVQFAIVLPTRSKADVDRYRAKRES